LAAETERFFRFFNRRTNLRIDRSTLADFAAPPKAQADPLQYQTTSGDLAVRTQ
jgi:hypothetical protein